MTDQGQKFIEAHTKRERPALVPEIELWLATEITPIWQALEDWSGESYLPPPFWAFAWPGGQALARHILDKPETVAGLRVMDFASGSGLSAIAAAMAGAKKAWAVDIDPLAELATQINAGLNGVTVENREITDMEKVPRDVDLIIAGDVCYEQTMSHRILRWLRLCAAGGVRVLLADPGRAYVPEDGLLELDRYTVPTTRELEDRDARDVTIWQLVG